MPNPSNRKRLPVVLPPPTATKNNKNVGGVVFGRNPQPADSGDFPPSELGQAAPFNVPPLPVNTFADAVSYYVNFVGDALERLNALQFDLTKTNQQKKAQDLSDALADLADTLNVGYSGNAKELRWPLAGAYSLSQDLNKFKLPGFASLVVDLYFENEPALRMVVNCTVLVTGTPSVTGQTVAPGGGALGQSMTASSYIATGSK